MQKTWPAFVSPFVWLSNHLYDAVPVRVFAPIECNHLGLRVSVWFLFAGTDSCSVHYQDWLTPYKCVQIHGICARHYALQRIPHIDMVMYKDGMVHMRTKILIHINGFYFPCPTKEQLKVTLVLIDHSDRKYIPGFSVYVISPGTSANRPGGIAVSLVL